MDTEDSVSQKEKEFKIKNEPLVVEKPVKMEDKDVSLEARKKAETVIFETLDLDPSIANLENFQELLKQAVESLPRYKELEEKLENVSPENLPYELFKTIQKSADIHLTEEQKENLPKDGVLIKSIKQGSPLMCAGRIMISSALLQKNGIEHNVVSTFEGDENEVSGHSVMLVNINAETLAYFDAADNLYFTFPRSALRGYEGENKTSKCHLEDYASRTNDVMDGFNSVTKDFIAWSKNEGTARQYLGNVAAALNGNDKFTNSNIAIDHEVAEAVNQIEKILLGENNAKEEYYTEENIIKIKKRKKENIQTALGYLWLYPEKNQFIEHFSNAFHENNGLGDDFSYLKNAAKEKRNECAEKFWDYLNSEGFRKETEPRKENPRNDLWEIYRTKNEGDLERLSQMMNQAETELSKIAAEIGDDQFRENLDWLLNNNNRIDLYHITAVVNGKPYDRADDEMDINKARQFLAYRKIQAILLTAGETDHIDASRLLSDFIEKNHTVPYLCNTAVESLAKSNIPEAKKKLFEIVDDPKYGFETRTRAVLAGLREEIQFESTKVIALLNEYVESLGEDLCQSIGTYNIIEIAGLLANNEARTILDDLQEKMQVLPPEKTQWFVRDIISTRLSIAADDKNEYIKKTLGERQYVSNEGIVFGTLDHDFDFKEFLTLHKNKFDKVTEIVSRINSAFRTEPIIYIDISTGDANEAGWTQNSIYFSRDYIKHSNNVDDLAQSAGHEACERWQSKGFIDVQLSEYYLQLMGQQYIGSELDKFRLKHRLIEETNAGHPWDGEREFIAELGSTLLVDPEKIKKLFDPSINKTSVEALGYLKKKLYLS